jgi:hypothetical protein
VRLEALDVAELLERALAPRPAERSGQ